MDLLRNNNRSEAAQTLYNIFESALNSLSLQVVGHHGRLLEQSVAHHTGGEHFHRGGAGGGADHCEVLWHRPSSPHRGSCCSTDARVKLLYIDLCLTLGLICGMEEILCA